MHQPFPRPATAAVKEVFKNPFTAHDTQTTRQRVECNSNARDDCQGHTLYFRDLQVKWLQRVNIPIFFWESKFYWSLKGPENDQKSNTARDLSKWFEISQPRPVRSPLISSNCRPSPSSCPARPMGQWASPARDEHCAAVAARSAGGGRHLSFLLLFFFSLFLNCLFCFDAICIFFSFASLVALPKHLPNNNTNNSVF